ncbi:DUF4157 domain-containing protein [bacterium]|nr:DUF4157 domain-containing protein [bacterium]
MKSYHKKINKKATKPEEPEQLSQGSNTPDTSPKKEAQKLADNSPQVQKTAQLKSVVQKNKKGLPDKLRSGVESLSGVPVDDVKVHYNSSKPKKMDAHAYAQGTDIHLGPGQEKHLPHEAWHVTQQKQGRVKPTTQANGKPVNDDTSLEKEADTMGKKAFQLKSTEQLSPKKETPTAFSLQGKSNSTTSGEVVQQKPFPVNKKFELEKTQFDSPEAYYHKIVLPWIKDVMKRHPEARTAAEKALLDAEEDSRDWNTLERLIRKVNRQIGVSPHFDGEVEELEPDEKAEIVGDAKNPFGEDPIMDKRAMTEVDAKRLANYFGLQDVSNTKWSCPDQTHSPQGKVYYSKKTKTYYGADMTGNMGFGFNVWVPSAKGKWVLDYVGNTPHTLDRLTKA